MIRSLQSRAVLLGEYISETGATVRAASKVFNVSKSTVHKDVTERLMRDDPVLYKAVSKVLQKNKEDNINNNRSLRERIKKQKSKDRKTINSRKSKEKKNINNYNKDNHKNNTKMNLLNRIVKTEINKNNMNRINNFKNTSDNKLNRKTQENNSKKLKNKKNFYLKNTNENLTFNNNEGNKITTIESLDDIDITGKQYIIKSKNKNEIPNNNITSNITTTLFSINSTELNEIDFNIYEKNKNIKNDFNLQLKDKKDNNKTNDNVTNDITTINQLDIKNNYIKLIDYYSLINHKLLKLHNKNILLEKKCNIFREKLFHELKKKII